MNIAALAIFILLFYGFPAGADEGDIKTIHFAEEANWPPFTPDKFGMATEGLSLRLMKEIFSRLDIEVDVELLPQKRMLEYLKKGQKDAATVISINKERLEFLDFTEPVFQKRGFVYFLSSRDPPIEWHSYEDLKGLRIGITAGHNYGDEFKEAARRYKLDLYEVPRVRQNFDMLLADRIDVFLCVEMTAGQFLRDSKYKGKIIHSPRSYYSKGYHIGFSKKSKAGVLIPEVNKVIRQMKEDGSLNRIIAEYKD